MRAKVAEFYSARSNKILLPLWTSFALPFTLERFYPYRRFKDKRFQFI